MTDFISGILNAAVKVDAQDPISMILLMMVCLVGAFYVVTRYISMPLRNDVKEMKALAKGMSQTLEEHDEAFKSKHVEIEKLVHSVLGLVKEGLKSIDQSLNDSSKTLETQTHNVLRAIEVVEHDISDKHGVVIKEIEDALSRLADLTEQHQRYAERAADKSETALRPISENLTAIRAELRNLGTLLQTAMYVNNRLK